MKVEIELPEIEGYEYTGEYRCPRAGELGYNHATGLPFTALESNAYMVSHLLKKVKPSLVGMLCEVWDYVDGDKYTAIITEFNSDQGHPYMEECGTSWRHAKPVSVAALSDCLDLAREYEKL